MCKSLLQLKNEGEKTIGVCRCGFKRTAGITISGEDNNAKEVTLGGGFVDSDTSKSEGFFRICEKCGHNQAEISQIISNESEISIFTCLKCGNRVRQSSGGSKA